MILALGLAGNAFGGTILTFDMKPFTVLGGSINAAYGDRVNAASDAVGFYGTDNGTYTPNVVTSYGGTPRTWTTGYANLTNVHYNDDEGGDLVLTFTADAGFLVRLVSFDLGSFSGTNRTLSNTAISIRDGANALVFSVNGPLVIGGSTANSFSPNVSAQQLVLRLHVGQLVNSSDDIAIDNVLFSQQAANVVPEPGTYALVGGALLAAAAARRKRT
ncbi:MAG: PEP-CTERM sorting domain-containing protein [Bryobacterales bacterium]|nr:PEP-CTERM sorting domain-containing protein [Bryobacterales bacterium]